MLQWLIGPTTISQVFSCSYLHNFRKPSSSCSRLCSLLSRFRLVRLELGRFHLSETIVSFRRALTRSDWNLLLAEGNLNFCLESEIKKWVVRLEMGEWLNHQSHRHSLNPFFHQGILMPSRARSWELRSACSTENIWCLTKCCRPSGCFRPNRRALCTTSICSSSPIRRTSSGSSRSSSNLIRCATSSTERSSRSRTRWKFWSV